MTEPGYHGRTPLHVAALHGNVDAINIFSKHLSDGAKEMPVLNTTDKDGYTPLEAALVLAPKDTGVEAAKALIRAGADLTTRNRGWRAVRLAIKSHNPEMVKFVIDELKKTKRYEKSAGKTPMEIFRKEELLIPQPERDAIRAHIMNYRGETAADADADNIRTLNR